MPLYTRTGDDGSTGLIGGQRALKDDLQIDCYGTVDELNAHLGLARSIAAEWLVERLLPIQEELFVAGSHLALAPGQDPQSWKLPHFTAAMIERLERQIDSSETELPKLRTFILPGGTELACRMHVARTVCRRAERLLVSFSRHRKLDDFLLIYFNRLSDWMFAHARLANHRAGVSDLAWIGNT